MFVQYDLYVTLLPGEIDVENDGSYQSAIFNIEIFPWCRKTVYKHFIPLSHSFVVLSETFTPPSFQPGNTYWRNLSPFVWRYQQLCPLLFVTLHQRAMFLQKLSQVSVLTIVWIEFSELCFHVSFICLFIMTEQTFVMIYVQIETRRQHNLAFCLNRIT